MVLQHLFPAFILIVVGAVLKRARLTDAAFLATTDRLIYFVFFPVMLFWKIGAANRQLAAEALNLYLAAACAVALIYVISTLFIRFLHVPAFQAGAFSQSCYRFNTYVGLAVILSVLGENGIALFGILIAVLIPMINILSVATLIWFSGRPQNWRFRLRTTAFSILTNPLVIGCAAGLIYAQWINTFPPLLENTFRLGAAVTLPLALLSIGGSLTPQTLKRHFNLAFAGTVFKLVLLPLIGAAWMRIFGVTDIYRSVGLIFFALPTSTAIYVLSSQLGSDTEFASASIVLSTALSFFSLSCVLWILHA
ncbi:MAG: AEC family transporter [Desulfobacteraceae bacterium]|nr:MAG: AEC family transporter [Desulfobacteraceae bacterium]